MIHRNDDIMMTIHAIETVIENDIVTLRGIPDLVNDPDHFHPRSDEIIHQTRNEAQELNIEAKKS